MAVPTLTSVKMKLANGTIANFAGTEGVLLDTGDGGLAVNTTLSPYLGGLTQLPNGDVLLQDGYRVRRVDGNGIITTFAGNGGKSHSGDGGLATLASIGQVSDLASDALGNVYIASYGQRIRKVDTSGIISTIAGIGTIESYVEVNNAAFTSDPDGGQATQMNLSIFGMTLSPDNELVFIDCVANTIRKIQKNGTVVSIAGNGVFGFSGDGGPARQAKLARPRGIAYNLFGELVIADSEASVVRKIDRDGVITTIAGVPGQSGFNGDSGNSLNVNIGIPYKIVVSPVAETSNVCQSRRCSIKRSPLLLPKYFIQCEDG